jgi:prepilin-type processing-associated H-X9-DG protein
LVELLVTIAVLAILLALLLPGISAARARAQTARCLSNLKQFGLAFQLYAGDHNDLIFANLGRHVPLGETWVEGWLGDPPGPDCTNTIYLRRSLASPYVPSVEMWRCPADQLRVGIFGQSFAKVRTISINHFMGAPWTYNPCTSYRRLSDIVQPSPSDAFVFIEERPQTINDGAFAVTEDFDETEPATWLMKDVPSTNHRGGCNLSFADGHVDYHRWRDARTRLPTHNDTSMPANPDCLWLEHHSTSRVPTH